MNVSVLGLSGRPHPAILNIRTTRDAMKLRSHIKFLSGDFPSYEVLAKERGGTPRCRLCPSASESTQHILTECAGTLDTRQRLYPELLNLLVTVHPSNGLLLYQYSADTLTQFILDPTSMNLSNQLRISPSHPGLSEIFSFSRDWCHCDSQSQTPPETMSVISTHLLSTCPVIPKSE